MAQKSLSLSVGLSGLLSLPKKILHKLGIDNSILVRIFGFPAMLIHGDPLVIDRWRWITQRLPHSTKKTLIDIGCGSGAFSIGAALKGYTALGLSWDERNNALANSRAEICGAATARFEVQDVRELDKRSDLVGKFDVALCCENIEHIINDEKLMRDIFATLKPGGRLLLTAPNLHYRPITHEDNGPFLPIEDGRHVRRGYSPEMLQALCQKTGFSLEEISYCSGFISQKLTGLQRWGGRIHPTLGWLIILPLRPLSLLFDSLLTPVLHWPCFSIGLIAKKHF